MLNFGKEIRLPKRANRHPLFGIGRLRRLKRAKVMLAVVAALAVLAPAAVAVVYGTAPSAQAVNNAQVLVSVQPVHPTTGAAITTAGWGQHTNRVAYRVDFSCIVEDCPAATVRLAPTSSTRITGFTGCSSRADLFLPRPADRSRDLRRQATR